MKKFLTTFFVAFIVLATNAQDLRLRFDDHIPLVDNLPKGYCQQYIAQRDDDELYYVVLRLKKGDPAKDSLRVFYGTRERLQEAPYKHSYIAFLSTDRIETTLFLLSFGPYDASIEPVQKTDLPADPDEDNRLTILYREK
ncbi:MAG TPA: hypothetical protein VL576_03405 [Candidatus Paceibacterota bacterium]|jgi:hypothetical protein|nr:hypothetical protein [Candidatus Paceibacterota bacterium]